MYHLDCDAVKCEVIHVCGSQAWIKVAGNHSNYGSKIVSCKSLYEHLPKGFFDLCDSLRMRCNMSSEAVVDSYNKGVRVVGDDGSFDNGEIVRFDPAVYKDN